MIAIWIIALLVSGFIGMCIGWLLKQSDKTPEVPVTIVSGRAFSLVELLASLDKNSGMVLYDREGRTHLALSYGQEGINLVESFADKTRTDGSKYWEWYKADLEFYTWKEFFKLFPEVVDDREGLKVVVSDKELKDLKKKAAIVKDAEEELTTWKN